jgi:hypothetical protein
MAIKKYPDVIKDVVSLNTSISMRLNSSYGLVCSTVDPNTGFIQIGGLNHPYNADCIAKLVQDIRTFGTERVEKNQVRNISSKHMKSPNSPTFKQLDA